jgi:hypothetical protein
MHVEKRHHRKPMARIALVPGLPRLFKLMTQ